MITIRKISERDGEIEREFLRSFPENENGFESPANGYAIDTPEGFAEFVQSRLDQENGVGLKEGYVPQTTFWIFSNGELAGVGKVRHYLTAGLLKNGGHIGIGIAPKFRGKGVGTDALDALVKYAKALGQSPILVTNEEDNAASRKISEKCGGILDKVADGTSYYWIP